jgi:hypothetical protein
MEGANHDARLLLRRLSVNALGSWSYGRCFLIYVVTFVALFANVFFGGEVVTPLRQGDFFAQPQAVSNRHPENQKFSDYVLYAVPEAQVFLHSKRSSWIATWNPYNELGRPTSHLSGLSPAYLPNWVISKLTDDAFGYVSAIVLLQMFLAGAFAFLLARELEWQPSAALVAALALGVSPNLIYWAAFPMFAGAYGWTIALLYAFLRWLKRSDLFAWSLMAFAVYSLLMTAYPVMVVYHAYLMLGFFIYLASTHPSFPRSLRPLLLSLAGSCTAVLFGLLAAAPALADTFIMTLQSSRTHPDVEFFRVAIPPLNTLVDWQRLLAYWTFPQVLGDPISAAYPTQFNGRSLAPFAVFLLAVAGWRRTWGWWVAIGVLLAAEAVPPIFVFAVLHLGLGVSRSVPSVHAIIPLVVIVAIGMDALSRRGSDVTAKRWPAWLVPVVLYLVLLGNACLAAIGLHLTIQWQMVGMLLAYVPIFIFAISYRRPALIVVVAVAHLLLFDRHLLLTQPRQSIVQTSAPVETLRGLLAGSGRFAVNASAAGFLLPNLNTQAMLPSVHSYDSLSSQRYRSLISRMGGEVTTFGRNSFWIDEKSVGSIDFKLANVVALVSREPIASAAVTEEAEVAGLHIYRVRDRLSRFTFFGADSSASLASSLWVTDATPFLNPGVANVDDDGDRIVVRFADRTQQATAMVVSQLFNPGWRAEGRVGDDWRALITTPVNDAFEGVVVPKDVDVVRLQFRPWIAWSWLGHIGFGLLALLVIWRRLANRMGDRPVKLSSTASLLQPDEDRH